MAVIMSNPEQSKHLETARMRIRGLWVDLVNLRRWVGVGVGWGGGVWGEGGGARPHPGGLHPHLTSPPTPPARPPARPPTPCALAAARSTLSTAASPR